MSQEKNHKLIFLTSIKIPLKITESQIHQYEKEGRYIMTKIILDIQKWTKIIYHIKKLKEEKSMLIFIYVEITFDPI